MWTGLPRNQWRSSCSPQMIWPGETALYFYSVVLLYEFVLLLWKDMPQLGCEVTEKVGIEFNMYSNSQRLVFP